MVDLKCSFVPTTILTTKPLKSVLTYIPYTFRGLVKRVSIFHMKQRKRELLDIVSSYRLALLALNVLCSGLIIRETCGGNVITVLRRLDVADLRHLEIVLILVFSRTRERFLHFLLTMIIHFCCTTETCVHQHRIMYIH